MKADGGHRRRLPRRGNLMARIRDGGTGVLFALVVAGLLAAGLMVGAASTAVTGRGSGSGGSSSGGGSSSSGSGSAPDFALAANYQPPSFVGHVVRGGLTSCDGCTTAVEPRYVGRSFSCFYDSNSLSLVSLNVVDVALVVGYAVVSLHRGSPRPYWSLLRRPRRGVVRGGGSHWLHKAILTLSSQKPTHGSPTVRNQAPA